MARNTKNSAHNYSANSLINKHDKCHRARTVFSVISAEMGPILGKKNNQGTNLQPRQSFVLQL